MRVFFVGLQNNWSYSQRHQLLSTLVVILQFSGDSSTYPEKWEDLNVLSYQGCALFMSRLYVA